MSLTLVPHAGYAGQFAREDQPPDQILRGGCSIMACATALTSAFRLSTHPVDMQALMIRLYDFAKRNGKCEDDGAMTLDEMLWLLTAYPAQTWGRRLPILHYQPFTGQPLALADWRPLFQELSGKYPIVCQFLNGQALQNVTHDGGADETGLKCHANCDVGQDPNVGTYFNDGDNSDCIQGKGFAIYDRDTIIRAQLDGFIVVGTPNAPSPIPPAPKVYVPTGWKYADSVLSGSNGRVVAPELVAYILHDPAWSGFNNPVGDPTRIGNEHVEQWFAETLLAWNPHDGAFVSTAGNAFMALQGNYEELQSHAINVGAFKGAIQEIETGLSVLKGTHANG